MAAASFNPAAAAARAVNVESNGIWLQVTAPTGISISVDGVPFSSESKLYVVKPDWSGRWYSWEFELPMDTVTTEPLAGGGTRITVPMRSKGGEFEGKQILDLTPDRQLRIELDARMAPGKEGRLENKVASIQPGWLVGRNYTVTSRSGETAERNAPAVAPSDEVRHAKLAEDFTTLTLDTRLGPLTLGSAGDASMTLVDYRKNKWASGKLYYWYGMLDRDISSTRPVTFETTFQFPPKPKRDADWTGTADGKILPLEKALQPEEAVDRIIPTPKKVAWGTKGLEADLSLANVRWKAENFELPHILAEASKDDARQQSAPPRNTDIFAWVSGKQAFNKTAEDKQWRADAVRLLSEFQKFAGSHSAEIKHVSWYAPNLWTDLQPSLAVHQAVRDKRPAGADSDEWYRLQVVPPYSSAEQGATTAAKSLHLPSLSGGLVLLEAETTAGVSHGLNTLRQLVRQRDGKVFLRSCSIEDWPSLSFRGIHFFTGKDAREIQTRMLRDILGPLKINALVYQADYLKWDSMPPGSHHPNHVMEKDDARAVADEAKRQGIEVVPLVNTFGHSEWLLENDQLRHLSDDKKTLYAYDPSNPEVYEICTKIYEEAIELFKPRLFHIGHDEVTIFGFPQKEENRKVGELELIIRDTLFYYNWLKERGLRTVMWGDMLLGPTEAGPDACLAPSDEEARERRARLPKDILLTDWHYEAAPLEKFTSLDLLSREGFDTIASTWFAPANVVRFAKVAEGNDDDSGTSASADLTRHQGGKTYGLLQTTWAGYNFNETAFRENPDQFAAYLLAAEAAWTGGYADPEDVPYDYRREFTRMWNRSQLPAGEARGWTVDFAGPKLPLAPDGQGRFLGTPVENPVPKNTSGETSGPAEFFPIEPGKAPLGRFQFRIGGADGVPEALLLHGQFNPEGDFPKTYTVNVGTTASAVQFAVAATFPGPAGAQIAETEIVFADGTSAGIPWRLEQTVYPLEDTRATPLAPLLWERAPRTPTEPAAAIHGYLWKNPTPGKPIEKIVFHSRGRGSALMVFGVTGIQE